MGGDDRGDTRDRTGAGGPLWSALRSHPVITATMAVCIVAGATLGWTLLTEEWSLLRRLLAGAVAGAGTGLLVTATRMLG